MDEEPLVGHRRVFGAEGGPDRSDDARALQGQNAGDLGETDIVANLHAEPCAEDRVGIDAVAAGEEQLLVLPLVDLGVVAQHALRPDQQRGVAHHARAQTVAQAEPDHEMHAMLRRERDQRLDLLAIRRGAGLVERGAEMRHLADQWTARHERLDIACIGQFREQDELGASGRFRGNFSAGAKDCTSSWTRLADIMRRLRRCGARR